MDIGARAARDQVASERLITAAQTLAERAGVPFAPDSLQRRDPDPAVTALFQREALADLLERIATPAQPEPPAKRSK